MEDRRNSFDTKIFFVNHLNLSSSDRDDMRPFPDGAYEETPVVEM
jgi:hypothetical protein